MDLIQELLNRLEKEIHKTPSGDLRNLLCDINIELACNRIEAKLANTPKKVFYSIIYYIPINTILLEIEAYCKEYNIEITKTATERVWKFIGKSEHNLNILGFRFLLKLK